MADEVKQGGSQRQQRARRILVVIALLVLVGLIGFLVYREKVDTPITERTTTQNDGNLKTTTNEEVIANIAEKVSPSVVSIVTNTTAQSVFGTATQAQAAGTGIIISQDGYILTNKHVVDGATSLQVYTADGTSYDNVSLVGTDPLNDVAYLKVNDVNNLTPATFGDSSTVRIGQEVVAIGNSLGQYQNTVTSGVISGKGRPITAGDQSGSSTENLTDLLQTDAAINPGNSGGPLLNRSGQVIGINTAVAQNAEGIGFAIPINATKGTTKSVLAGKGVQRSYLGIRYIELTPAVKKQYDVSVAQGAYVYSPNGQSAVQASGPAAKAGVKDKDIITKVNGLEVGSRGSVSSLIGEYAPGDKVVLTLLRDGKTIDLPVVLGKFLVD